MSLMALARVVEAETTLHIMMTVLGGALVVTCLSLVVIAGIFILRNLLK